MAVEITGTYTGDLKMELRHGPSGMRLTTAAPRDNLGDGSSFSPTDLLAAALGSCMVSTMAIVAKRSDIPFEHAAFSLEKHMTASPPRRVDAVPVTIRLSASLTPEQREMLEHAARHCPVERSLAPEIRRDVQFIYE
jgi:uncharacterized OsmC-like protein